MEKKNDVVTTMKTLFEVQVGEGIPVQFKFEETDASDAQVSFDAGNSWADSYTVWKAMERFCDRFPNAFGEE